MKLGARDQWQVWLKRKAICPSQPRCVVRESRVLTRPVLVVVQRPHQPSFISNEDLEGAFHSAVGDGFTRTRWGNRASSNCRPTSSRFGSINSPRALPKPRTK